MQEGVNKRLRHFVEKRYRPFVNRCIDYRYTTLALFLSGLVLCAGLLLGGVVRTVISPDVPGEFLNVELRMADGTPEERTLEALLLINTALEQVEADHQARVGRDEKLVKHVAAYGYDRINGRMDVELTKEDERSISTQEIEQAWRDAVGTLHGAEVMAINSEDGPRSIGPDIAFDLMHNNLDTLREASAELEDALRHYEGVYDIRNGASDTADEFHLEILPEAESLGLTRFDLGNQVRHAFYGAEAQRVQRGIDEIKVMVRYPEADRETISSLDDMYIRTPQGDEVPFDTVARIDVRQGMLKATHINYQRAAEVTAEANKSIIEPSRVLRDVENNVMPALMAKYPGLNWGISGLSDEESKFVVSMFIGFGLALFGIYALLAIPTRSYLQPLIIMGVIPFGMIGAVVGHWLLELPLSMMSLMGLIALSGVVVNDSLILVDYVNKTVRDGVPLRQAVLDAGARRFRAILLTSLTTFFGLVPMLLERSVQAMQIVPMAVSLAFGIVFATVITLLLVPCLYMILADLDNWWKGRAGTEVPVDDSAIGGAAGQA